MSTDFFKAQDQARSRTKGLVVLFTLAVLTLLLLTNLLILIGLGLLQPEQLEMLRQPQHPLWFSALPWSVIGWTSATLLAVIGIVVALKNAELQQGGQVIAKALGGTLVSHGQADPKQKMLLNIVEEMAIAAGVPVPPVYLLPEKAINAFAAGYSVSDAVIGVTQGCLHDLTRDQLQGVIAHEFSHILNGDMRLNIRLIALLQGILFIGHAGYYLLRSSHSSSALRTSNSRSKNNGGGLLFIAVGLMVLGYVGSFFGNLIKAAVSRQREYLADASAVQFTRNPHGISGALKAIGASAAGSRIKHPNADEMSHLFFGEAISRWTSLFATHPPLAERIKRLDPAWLGKYPTLDETAAVAAAEMAATSPMTKEKILQTLQTLPAMLLQSSRHAPSAPALVLASLWQAEHLKKQAHLVKELGNKTLLHETDRLYEQMQLLKPSQKLHLLQLSIPALKQLSAEKFRDLFQLAEALVQVDAKIELFEWTLLCWLEHCVGIQFDPEQIYRTDKASRLSHIETSALILLSVCAQQAAECGGKARDADPAVLQAWRAGLESLGLEFRPYQQHSLTEFKAILPELLQAAPLLKKSLWQMLNVAIQADQQQRPNEAVLLQAMALLLEIPTNSATTGN